MFSRSGSLVKHCWGSQREIYYSTRPRLISFENPLALRTSSYLAILTHEKLGNLAIAKASPRLYLELFNVKLAA